MADDRRAVLLGLGAVGLWSTVATAFKVALLELGPLELIWVASCVSWVFFTAWVAWRRQLSAALTAGWGTALWSGLLNPVTYYLVLFAAYDRLPGQEAMALNYTWALTMALLAVPILGQRLTRLDVVAGLIAYLGVWVIATRGEVLSVQFDNVEGVLAAVVSTVIWALYWLMSARDAREPAIAQWQNFSVAVPVLSGALWWTGGLSIAPSPSLAAAVYVGLFEMGVSFALWQAAMRLVSRTAKVSTLIFLSPPVSLVLLWAVLGEALLPSTGVALLLILGGLALQTWGSLGRRAQAG